MERMGYKLTTQHGIGTFSDKDDVKLLDVESQYELLRIKRDFLFPKSKVVLDMKAKRDLVPLEADKILSIAPKGDTETRVLGSHKR